MTRHNRRPRAAAAAILLPLLVAGCGGSVKGGSAHETTEGSEQPVPSASPSPSAAATPHQKITDILMDDPLTGRDRTLAMELSHSRELVTELMGLGITLPAASQVTSQYMGGVMDPSDDRLEALLIAGGSKDFDESRQLSDERDAEDEKVGETIANPLGDEAARTQLWKRQLLKRAQEVVDECAKVKQEATNPDLRQAAVENTAAFKELIAAVEKV